MPIKACADKLKREMEDFGFPPAFPEDDGASSAEAAKDNDEFVIKDKAKGERYFLRLVCLNGNSFSFFLDRQEEQGSSQIFWSQVPVGNHEEHGFHR